MITGVNDLPWLQRERKVREITLPLMQQLENDGRWELTRLPTLKEDKAGIDFFVKIRDFDNLKKTNKEIPIQFKIRSKPKYQDLIVARYQPCYGMDQEIFPRSRKGVSSQTAEGRDWRGVIDGVSALYFVATMNEYSEYDTVSYISSNKLKKHVLEVDEAWEQCDKEGKIRPKSFFTKRVITAMLKDNPIKDRSQVFHQHPGDEVWYQKNLNESPKFLMYIHSSRRDGHCVIDPVELCKTKEELKQEGMI